MRHRFAATLTVAALAFAPAIVMAAPADAAGCVTKSEFRRVKQGFTKPRVHRVFGTAGKQTFVFPGYESRDYRVCNSRWGWVTVDYDRGRLDSKSAYWG